jgi:hypothetical protein
MNLAEDPHVAILMLRKRAGRRSRRRRATRLSPGRSKWPLRVDFRLGAISGKRPARMSAFGRGASVRAPRETGRPAARSDSGAHRTLGPAGRGGEQTVRRA